VIARLVWNHRAWRTLAFAGVFSLWIGYFWSIAYEKDGDLTGVDIAAVWLPFAGYLTFSQFWRRASEWEMSLPLRPGILWTAQAISLVIGAAVILGLTVFSATVFSPADRHILERGVGILSGMVFAVALLLAIQPKQSETPPSRRLFLDAFPRCLAAILVTIYILSRSAAWSLLGFALAAGVFAFTYRSLPQSYQLVAPEPVHGRRTLSPPSPTRPGPILWTIFRIIYTWEWQIVLGGLLVVAFLPGSGDFAWMILAFLPAVFLPALQALPKLAPLPVSRLVIYALATLTPVGMWLLGLGAGSLLWGTGNSTLLLVHQPSGPDSLDWLLLRWDARAWAVCSAMFGVVMCMGQFSQMAAGLIRRDSLALRALKVSISIVYTLPLLFLVWLSLEASPWATRFHETARFHAATWFVWIVEALPSGFVAWGLAGIILGALFLLMTRLFESIDALGIPDCWT
jgi:hypothetical protein